jgi:hypothetical protein
LGEIALAVPGSMAILAERMAHNVRAINSTDSICKKWKELRVSNNFDRRRAVRIRESDICGIYWWGRECEENLFEIS